MAIIKLSPDEFLRSGKHGGQSVQKSGQGLSLKNKNVVRSWRSPIQLSAKYFTFYAVNQWKLLSSGSKELWQLWATTYPQPTKLNKFAYLSGYELFVKRNYYLYLTNPITFNWMISPDFVQYPFDYLVTTIQASDTKIQVKCDFSINSGKWDCLLFISNTQSTGLSFGDTRWRFVGSIRSSNQTIDVTTNYLKHFGTLPVLGSNLFISTVMCGFDNGQFTFHQLYKQVVEPTAPPYIPTNFGRMYNGRIVKDLRNIANVGYRVFSYDDFAYLYNNFPPYSTLGARMKSVGLDFWNTPNLDASDIYGFNARGSGYRDSAGVFNFFKNYSYIATSQELLPSLVFSFYLSNATKALGSGYIDAKRSFSIRLVKEISVFEEFYTGNDGRQYKNCQIGNLVISGENIAETKFRTGEVIPCITDSATWATNADSYTCDPENNPLLV